MTPSETRRKDWAEYKLVVKDFLKDPETASCLDGPLDQGLNGNLYQQLDGPGRKRIVDTTRIFRPTRKLDHIAMCGGILLWISHITAALGFVLITNSSGPNSHLMAEL